MNMNEYLIELWCFWRTSESHYYLSSWYILEIPFVSYRMEDSWRFRHKILGHLGPIEKNLNFLSPLRSLEFTIFWALDLYWSCPTQKFSTTVWIMPLLQILRKLRSFIIYTLLQNKRARCQSGRPPFRSFENRWRNMDILYIILKGIVWRFRFILNFFKIFWFREFMTKFSRNDSPMAPEQMSEKIQTFKISTYYISF